MIEDTGVTVICMKDTTTIVVMITHMGQFVTDVFDVAIVE
jgi:hypothetical protein